MADRRGELVQRTHGGRVARDSSIFSLLVHPLPSVIHVNNTTRTSHSNPSITTKLRRPILSTEFQHRGTHGTGVDPARDDTVRSRGPFGDFTVLADNRHTLAVAPPFEISDTSAAVNAHLRNPLRGSRVEHVDETTALPRRSNESDIPSAGRELEPFHGLLLLLAVCGAVDFVHFARVQIPDVEVAAAAGGEDFGAGWVGEGGGVDGRAADMKGREEGVGGGC